MTFTFQLRLSQMDRHCELGCVRLEAMTDGVSDPVEKKHFWYAEMESNPHIQPIDSTKAG
jgi:hypothetical protein